MKKIIYKFVSQNVRLGERIALNPSILQQNVEVFIEYNWFETGLIGRLL
jgi:hypothetical protein